MGKILIIKGADFENVAVGKVEPIEPIGKVTIKVLANPSGGGTISGGGSYDKGTQVTITATASSDYKFKQWNDGNTSATRAITASSSATYTAVFEESSIPTGYAELTLNGSEDWQFNTSGEPNGSGIYYCYLMNPATVNPDINDGFVDASCDNSVLNRNIRPSAENRANLTTPGFGYFASDPSLFIRFDNSIATSVATFKAYLAANPLIITYKQNA